MISQKELKLFRIEFRQFLKVNCTNISSDPFLDKTHGMACFYDNMKKSTVLYFHAQSFLCIIKMLTCILTRR